MKRTLLLVLILGLPRHSFSQTEFHPFIEEIVAAISQDEYTAKWQTLDDFETRFYNRPENELAAQWIYETLASYGLEVENHFYSHEGERGEYRNVIGTLPGSIEPDEVVYMTAHFDSTSRDETHAPGANDNASGVAAFLEAARILSDYRFSRTVKFVGFNSEEQGLRGSRAYVDDIASSENVVGCFNLDVIACSDDGDQFSIIANQASVSLAYLVQDACLEYIPEFITPVLHVGDFVAFKSSSDHWSFWGTGPAICVAGAGGCSIPIHSDEDRIENYPKDYPTVVTRAVTAAVAQAAGVISFENGLTPFVRGDVAGDMGVDLGDVVASVDGLFPGFILIRGDANPRRCPDAADANDDGVHDLTDVVYLARFLFGGGPQPPAPFPECGFDETDDALWCFSRCVNDTPVECEGPVAAFTLTRGEGEWPVKVEVDAGATAAAFPDTTITSYTWDFGDGGTEEGVVASHTYTAPGTFAITLRATDHRGCVGTATKTIDVLFPSRVEPPWSATDVGEADIPGGTRFEGDCMVVLPLDGDISFSSRSDDFHFVHQRIAGDFHFVARLGEWSEADARAWPEVGLMVRESLDPGARHGSVVLELQSSGKFLHRFVRREESGGMTRRASTARYDRLDPWLRVARDGPVISGSLSVDGVNWTEPNTVELVELAEEVHVGVASTRGAFSRTGAWPLATVCDLWLTAFTLTRGEGECPVEVEVDAGATAAAFPDRTITSYTWDFGDGGAEEGVVARHTYTTPGTFAITLRATDNRGWSGTTTKTIDVLFPSQVEPPWSATDVGEADIPGGTRFEGDCMVVLPLVGNISLRSDDFHFVHQRIAGDFSFVARLSEWSETDVRSGPEVGLMVRETLDPGARHGSVVLGPRSSERFRHRFAKRQETGGSTRYASNELYDHLDLWLRVVRTGPEISGSLSVDGVNWTEPDAVELVDLAEEVLVGVAATRGAFSGTGAWPLATVCDLSLTARDRVPQR